MTANDLRHTATTAADTTQRERQVTEMDLQSAVRKHRVSLEHYMDGRRVGSDETFEVRSPARWEEPGVQVARATAAQVEEAVSASARAFPAWANLSSHEREQYLLRLADLIEQNEERIAEIEARDCGMLERSLKARVVKRAASNYRFYAELAGTYEGRAWASNQTQNRVLRMPAGPAAVITPWNAPFMLSTWKTAPALAAGCTITLKPAEWAPLSCSILAELVDEAGFPPGVFNLVQGIGSEAGAALVSDPRIRRIGFTGSPETGRAIAAAAAKNLVPVSFELGGKSPFIVFADADIEAAAQKAAGQYDDAGQVCLAGTRLLVEQSVYGRFLEAFYRYAELHVQGDPTNDATTVSALVHAEHLARVEGFVDRARANGDTVLRGGRKSELGGLWYEPTLIVPRSNDSEIVQREVFGPVLTIQTFSSEDEAISLANSTAYGLAAVIYTSSEDRMQRMGQAVRAGTVWGNCFFVRDLSAPFGGTGISGMGREGGDYALDFYSDLKTLQVREGTTWS